MSAGPLISLRNVVKRYRLGDVETEVLKGVSLDVEPGEFTALRGPSGSGKSTLLHVIGLLDRPDQGQYLLQGKDVAGMDDDALSGLRNQLIGFVFQSFHLIPYATALGNVMLPCLYAPVAGSHGRRRAEELLTTLGLGKHMNHKPSQLSGGQQQRVALARALVNSPALILADEPTGQLDAATSAEIMGLLAEINARDGVTVLVVTHDEATAAYARRTVLVDDGRLA